MLLHRVLTSLVGVPIILAAIWFGPPWLTVVVAVAAVIGVREAYRMCPAVIPRDTDESGASSRLPLLLGGAWAVALVLAGELAGGPRDFGLAAAVICLFGLIASGLWIIAAWHGRQPTVAVLYLLLVPVYIGGALACVVALRGVIGPEIPLPGAALADSGAQWLLPEIDEEEITEPVVELVARAADESAGFWLLPSLASDEVVGAVAGATNAGCWWLLLGILTVYAADIGAYAVGRLVGRRLMAPGISPGKTWEGTAGGLASAAVTAVALGVLFPVGLEIWQLAAIGVILGIVSPAGDLLESKIKRLADVKDSGNLFPGHGGMLDRLDSLLPSLTVVYILAAVSVQPS